MGRLRWARIQGGTSRFWRIKDGLLILPGGLDRATFPAELLRDAAATSSFLDELSRLPWVPAGAIDDFRRLRDGAAA